MAYKFESSWKEGVLRKFGKKFGPFNFGPPKMEDFLDPFNFRPPRTKIKGGRKLKGIR